MHGSLLALLLLQVACCVCSLDGVQLCLLTRRRREAAVCHSTGLVRKYNFMQLCTPNAQNSRVDASASYEFSNGVTIFGEAINLLNEDRRGHRRADQAVYFAAPGHARYTAGLRFTW